MHRLLSRKQCGPPPHQRAECQTQKPLCGGGSLSPRTGPATRPRRLCPALGGAQPPKCSPAWLRPGTGKAVWAPDIATQLLALGCCPGPGPGPGARPHVAHCTPAQRAPPPSWGVPVPAWVAGKVPGEGRHPALNPTLGSSAGPTGFASETKIPVPPSHLHGHPNNPGCHCRQPPPPAHNSL